MKQEQRKQQQRSIKTKVGSQRRLNKIDKTLARLLKKKIRGIKLIKLDEKGESTTDTEILRIYESTTSNYIPIKVDNLEEMDCTRRIRKYKQTNTSSEIQTVTKIF